MNELRPRLAIAIQKSGGGIGKLTEGSVSLLEECDFKFSLSPRLDSTQVTNYPFDILSLRSRDIPRLMNKGLVDLGIVGLDVLIESGVPLIGLMPLNFGQCKLALGVREDFKYQQPEDLENKKIATSYPNITSNFFQDRRVPIELLYLEGSVELAGFRKWANGVVDVMESGSSMLTNSLEPKEVLFDSEAWLVASPSLREKKGSERIVEEFLVRCSALLRSRQNRFIVVNVPAGIEQSVRDLVPGLLSPTISACVDPRWLEISSVVPSDNYWEIIDKLKELGARDIVDLDMKRAIPNRDDPSISQMMTSIYSSGTEVDTAIKATPTPSPLIKEVQDQLGMNFFGLKPDDIGTLLAAFEQRTIPFDVVAAVINKQAEIQGLHPDKYPFDDTVYDLVSIKLAKFDTGQIWQTVEREFLERNRADLVMVYGYDGPINGITGLLAHYALTKMDIKELNRVGKEVHF